MKKKILRWLDDICFIAGGVSLTIAGFIFNPVAGFGILGAVLISYALLISRR